MAQKVYVVEGRQFRTDTDYRKALRDKQIIDQLREKVDFGNRSQLEQLVKQLKQNKVQFHTMLGQDFIEEAEDALKQLSGKSAKGRAARTKAPRKAAKKQGKAPAKHPAGRTAGESPGQKDARMEAYVQA